MNPKIWESVEQNGLWSFTRPFFCRHQTKIKNSCLVTKLQENHPKSHYSGKCIVQLPEQAYPRKSDLFPFTHLSCNLLCIGNATGISIFLTWSFY